MRAWRVHEAGEPERVLRLEHVAEPQPAAGEVLVRVAATALNFSDVLLCRGEYQEKPPRPFVPGLEASGRVVALGAGADPALLGRRVIAFLRSGGCFAELVRVPASSVFPVPDSLDDVTAAALHVTYQTGYVALHRRAAIRPGETLLVHAGAGGVGSAAIQLGVAARARVFATAGGPEKVARCRELGAELAVDYRADDFVEAVKAATDGRGVDVVYDSVGGDTFDRSRRCIAFEGRILVIGFAGGRVADAPTNHILIKGYSVVGLHWGLYQERAPEVIAETHAALVRLHEAGAIAPLVSGVISLAGIPAALAALGAGATQGKVVARL